MIGIILSAIFPGLGQIYFKRMTRGILLMALSLIPFLYPILLIISIIDCVRLNKRIPKEERLSGKEAIIGLVIFFVITPALLLVAFYGLFAGTNVLSDYYFYPRNTKKEMVTITSELERFKQQKGVYPINLSQIIKSKPTKSTYLKDSWERDYFYETTGDNSQFKLTSSGADGEMNTADDLMIEKR